MENGPLDPLEREIVDHWFAFFPSAAVDLGLHEYDGRLPIVDSAATDAWISQADRLLARLWTVPESNLPEERRVDRFLLRLLLESPLFDLREVRTLERNPMFYLGAVAITPYLVRPYAPPAQRIAAMARVLRGAPPLLATGRRRLRGPLPQPLIELGLTIGEGLPSHFAEGESFAAGEGRGDELHDLRARAEAAVVEFTEWLRHEELPRADPEFALGPERYQRLLFVREGIEAPFEEMRRAGEADLARNQRRLAELASAQGVALPALFRRIADDHPAAPDVVATAQAFVQETLRFVREKDLVTVPEPAIVRVEETPVWSRALSTASMNSPGPFEAGPEGVYYVTPVEPSWTPAEQEEWLRSFNRKMLRNITVHEVYPGHYLQFLHCRRSRMSLARKVYFSPSFVEGWAHYTESLAIEAGLGAPDPTAEVEQLHDALLRDCRLLSSIGLHTGGWTVARATELFEREAHMDHLPAQREAIRGTHNPEYYCYTLGKLAILSAREELLASGFDGSLRRFHDALLATGCPPVGLLTTLLARRPDPAP